MTPAPVDLTNCDREPIHIPGAIQPHGVLLAVTEPQLRIAQISSNCADWLVRPPEALLGLTLDAVLDASSLAAMRAAIATPDPRSASPVRLTSAAECGGRGFDGIMHRSGGRLVLELETSDPSKDSFGAFYRRVRSAIAQLQRADRVVEICQLAVDEVSSMTGFDRVMAYRFDRDGHGHVIAEKKKADLESFLDLHYPASDIPAQARRLYAVNWLRLIPDVSYRPARLVPETIAGAPLDLSFAVLRAVSPIHIEYLHNMGVRASMSVSLVVEGALWGMIICHHYAPSFVAYETRNACEVLGQALSWQVAARERADAFEARAEAQRTLAKIIEAFSGAPDLAAAITADAQPLLGLVGATGAAIRIGRTWTTLGRTPASAALDLVAEAVSGRLVDGSLATDALVDIAPEARAFDALASGVLAVGLASQDEDIVLWFRPELVQTVNWAGDPHKDLSLSSGEARLSPRGSFALWRETVRSRSRPWEPWAVEAANDLRVSLIGRVLRRNQELAVLNADLEAMVAERTGALSTARDELAKHAISLARSNEELERFAYVASHDLQEPLRMVVSYVQLLARRYRNKLDSDADEFIDFAVDGAKRMQSLINDLLAYSRVGRAERPESSVDLEEIFAQALVNVQVAIAESNGEVSHAPLPTVIGDKIELGQLFQNLLSNGLKFHGDRPARIRVTATRAPHAWTFAFRDDGIGIDPAHIDRIFIIFQRLHTRAEYPGSGIGLAIAKKVVERHGGRIWVESAPGAGTTFFFTLPA